MAGLGTGYGAILIDPPWAFRVWSKDVGSKRSASSHYTTMSREDINALPVGEHAADDCVLFCWACWPSFDEALEAIAAWGFIYKTMGFVWVKGEGLPLFPEDIKTQVGMGYWTRANTEPCLLATRGKPKRRNADVRQVILDKRREHSRKPDEIYSRIERLVDGPYLEMFARQRWPGWDSWGNEVEKF
jgi:N6-adenosine-specific RNA methylase IME4